MKPFCCEMSRSARESKYLDLNAMQSSEVTCNAMQSSEVTCNAMQCNKKALFSKFEVNYGYYILLIKM